LNSYSNNRVPSGHTGERLPGVFSPWPLSKIIVFIIPLFLYSLLKYQFKHQHQQSSGKTAGHIADNIIHACRARLKIALRQFDQYAKYGSQYNSRKESGQNRVPVVEPHPEIKEDNACNQRVERMNAIAGDANKCCQFPYKFNYLFYVSNF
jgi:hypothetical protein